MAEDPNVRSQRWVFTRNHPECDIDFIAKAKDFLESNRVVMAVVGKEHYEGPGTPHFQGYFVCDKVYYRSTIATYLPGAYLAPAHGGRKANWLYCTKEGNIWFEKGYHVSDEERAKDTTGFAKLYEEMKTMTPMQFETEHPMFMFNHRKQVMDTMIGLAHFNQIFNGELQKKNYWVFGKTGTGKTSWVYKQCTSGNHHIYRKAISKWWDGFDMWIHDCVLVDEWPCLANGKENLADCLCSLLKNWADRYPFIGEKKGSSVEISPNGFVLVVTSQFRISECFANPLDVQALERRFHQIEFKFPKDPETGRRLSYLTNPGREYGEMYDEHGELIEEYISIDWSMIRGPGI